MTKYNVEVCVASARGLRRSFFRSQWFAVAWFDPERKYCTKVDARGGTCPIWNTKFVATLEGAGAMEDAALHVEVYSREPLFLREKLEGTARIFLREFLSKLDQSPVLGVVESVSFQLRKKNSTKPRGFVDISVRISDRADEGWSPHAGTDGAFNGISVSISGGNEGLYSNATQPHSLPPPPPQGRLEDYYSKPLFQPHGARPATSLPAPQVRPQDYYSQPQFQGSGARPTTPPPPPPPSNAGFLLPPFASSAGQAGGNYLSMPARSSATERIGRLGPGFGMGAAGGAMAAGAFLFGDDFLNAMDYSSSLDGGSVINLS